MKQSSILIVLTIFLSTHWVGAQSFKIVKDPLGNEITINEDSAHIFNAFGNLLAFTINQEDDTRNVLVFNGDTSYWLFNQGFDKHLNVTPFTRTEKFGIPGNYVWFSIGNIWYESKGLPSNTIIFNNNDNVDSTYKYVQLFNFKTGDLGIEAILKTTGDTLVLFYNPTSKQYQIFKDELDNPIKVIQVAERFGSGESKDFVGAQFNPITQEFDFYGIYSWAAGELNQILELGKRPKYDLRFVYKDYTVYQYIIDRISDTATKVYEYNTSSGNFDDVTTTVISTYEVVDAYNLPSVYFDGDLNDVHSYTESIWKCKTQLGAIRYFIRSPFISNTEVNNLRDQPTAMFMYASVDDDSIYYYNYSLTQRGLIRFNTINKTNVFDPTSIPFSQDYQIRGWKGKMYFGRYDQITGKISAAYKDFDDGSYSFIESKNGEKADQPIDFTFLDDRVFIHSNQTDGVKLLYFDPTPIVATKDIEREDLGILISPNPSTGNFVVNLTKADHTWTNYTVYNSNGQSITKGELSSLQSVINLSNQAPGLYYVTFINGNKVITKAFTIE